MARRLFCVAVLTLVASASLVASGPGARAASETPSNVTCHSGDIITGFWGNVTVPPGNYCELLQAIVEGSVTANGAKQLGVDNSTITGNISVNSVTDNGWICGSRIGGNITANYAVANPETANSPGYWDIGYADPTYCGFTSFDPVPGNSIMGTLTVQHNKNGVKIGNDDIESKLTCGYNSPAPTGSNNQIDGTKTGCASVTTGPDNDTSSPGDND